ncbi:MAG: hypothetical protein U0T73_03555 [Chitinophagales bacterium]
MKRFLVIGLLLAGFTAFSQKKDKPGYCLMRVFDVNKFAASGSGFMGSQILITYENGEQEKIELQSYSEKTEPENLKIIVSTLNNLKAKGYLLMSANSTGDQGNIVTDYILLRNF